MKKIAIDIDDTITNTSEILFYYLKQYKKVDLNDPINNKTDIMRGKITCPELLDFYNEYAVEIAKSVKLKEWVKPALEYLDSSFEIHILSSRIAATLSATINYFKTNGLLYDYLLVNVYDKKAYCQQNNISFIIDDSIETCQQFKGSTTIPILFSSLINKKFHDENITRLNKWSDIKMIGLEN